jgi:hypothetical protein
VQNRRIYPVRCDPGLRCVVATHPHTEPSMRFLFVGSHLCTWASFRQSLAGLPLPSASGYPFDIGSSHRGLSPHKLMPMSGVHKALEGSAQQRARCWVPSSLRSSTPAHCYLYLAASRFGANVLMLQIFELRNSVQ